MLQNGMQRYSAYRFSDVAEEPCTMFLPMEGFKKKPLVTLEEATKPLISIVPRIEMYVKIAKERAINPVDNLSTDESASIALYTMEWEPYTESLYYILNSRLRSESRDDLKPWFLYLKLICTALSRLPSIEMTVYRGVRIILEHEHAKYQVGNQLVWWGFSSCSTRRDISEKERFLEGEGVRTLLIIHCVQGKSIISHSYYRDEREILLLPATTVTVIAHECQGDLHIIHLQEVESLSIISEPVSTEEEIQNLKRISTLEVETMLESAVSMDANHYLNAQINQYMVELKTQSEIYLIGKRFTDDDVGIVLQQLKTDKRCRALFLRENRVTSKLAFIISEVLRQNNTLQQLFISHSELGDNGTKILIEALSNNNRTTLKQLCLGFNGITDEGIEYIANMLESNRALTDLWLPSNEISDRGLVRLAQVLISKNKTLKILSLEWNKFRSEKSIDILLEMLKNNTSLIELNLRSCKLPKLGLSRLKCIAKTKNNFKLLH